MCDIWVGVRGGRGELGLQHVSFSRHHPRPMVELLTSSSPLFCRRPSLALIMATEPDATLLAQEDPSAFYVPGASPPAGADVDAESVLQLWGQASGGAFDNYGNFLTSLKSAGGWTCSRVGVGVWSAGVSGVRML
jgi:hypothetical protein